MDAGPLRVWIDTDAACGEGMTRDVDDCLALLAIAHRQDVRIAGLSTTFGNAPRKTVDAVAGQMAGLWRAQFGAAPTPVSGARGKGDCVDNAAARAIAAALREGPMTFLALGPLTNLACVLEADPVLAGRLVQVVFVGGARAGHVFHPAEDARANAFLGQGPIARDLNVALDPHAARRVLAAPVRLRLTPYELARQVEIAGADLDGLAQSGPMAREVAGRSRPWLASWKTWAGRDGFYPFDLMAAVAVLEPTALVCRRAPARVAADRAISGHAYGPKRLIVGDVGWPEAAPGSVEVCAGLSRGAGAVTSTLTGART